MVVRQRCINICRGGKTRLFSFFFFSHFELLFQDFNRQLTKRFIANFILRGGQ